MTNLEENLKQINAKYVRLAEEAKRMNSSKLNEVLTAIIENMKGNKLFKALCKRNPHYAGSYFDGLKVSEPNEYDIDILLDLPKLSKPDMKPTKPGYVSVAINLIEIERQDYLKDFRDLSKFIDESNHLDISKVNKWFEGLVQKAINDLILDGRFKMRKSGPAKTVSVFINKYDYFDVDLVPCFFFASEYWPVGYRQNNIDIGFHIVPKPLKSGNNKMWRTSFDIQEKEIIKDIGKIKPALRLIKVLRDKQNFPLKSYFIKTVFLWELKDKESYYRSKSLSDTYMEMMTKLQYYVERKNIDFFWDEKLNLLEDWSDIQCTNVSDRLRNIIRNIEIDSDNVWKYYGSPDLPPSFDEITAGHGSQETATVNNNWGLIGGIVGGIAAIGLGAIATFAFVRNRQRNDN